MFDQLKVISLNEDEKTLTILDQTKLPNTEEYLTLSTAQEMWDAIKKLQVRGAPAIGVFAGYAIAVLAKQQTHLACNAFKEKLKEDAKYLNSSRPTAVNLSWALNRQINYLDTLTDHDPEELASKMIKEAKRIDEENFAMNEKIAEYGVTLLKDGDGVLTHCNAGYLACLGYGTATAPMYKAHELGYNIHVYSDETRPLLQGARLTAYELSKAGLNVTSICDNMASLVMKEGKIQAVMVGCDRIAANGDFANKIGTSGVAILAKHYGIPFYTLGPSSTVDFNTPDGDSITIEQRDSDEIRSMWYETPKILKEVDCYNPSFDVTDHNLVTGIVTEKGIVYPPFEENLKKMLKGE